MILRPYQRKSVDDVFRHFENGGGDTCVVIPTAGGKSLCLSQFIKEACEQYSDTRFIVISHVAELLVQDCEKLITIWPEAPIGFYCASLGQKKLQSQILFASIQSIYKQAYKRQANDVIIVDESHLISPKETTRYQQFLNDVRTINPHCRIIGYTASPFRLDSGMIYGQPDSLFKNCCHETSVVELIEAGYLAPISTKRTHEELDTTGVHLRGGEFIASELASAVDKDEVTRACVDEIVKLNLTPHIVFATSVAHADHIRDELRARGCTAESINGETPKADRDKWIGQARREELQYLVNCQVLTTGVDIPALRAGSDLAPTQSPALYIQKIGRIMRLFPGKERGVWLDFARNVDLHGPIDLIKPKPKGAKGSGDAPSKTCPECDEKVWAGLRECACGYEFPPPEVKFTPKASEAAIISTQIEAHWLPIKDVSYSLHRKMGKPDSMRVTYQHGMTFSHEWQCFDHTGYARQKAERWWAMRGNRPIPASVEDALTRKAELRKPVAIKVRPNGKYVDIVDFDFGEQEEAA